MLFSVTLSLSLSLSPSQTHSVPLWKFLLFKEVRFVNENSLLEQGLQCGLGILTGNVIVCN